MARQFHKTINTRMIIQNPILFFLSYYLYDKMILEIFFLHLDLISDASPNGKTHNKPFVTLK